MNTLLMCRHHSPLWLRATPDKKIPLGGKVSNFFRENQKKKEGKNTLIINNQSLKDCIPLFAF